MMFSVLLLVCLVASVVSMPYYAPLQGAVGGMRTLVLLDNMPSRQLYSSYFNSLERDGYTLTLDSVQPHVGTQEIRRVPLRQCRGLCA